MPPNEVDRGGRPLTWRRHDVPQLSSQLIRQALGIKMTLRPKETIQKALISTTSRLIGEYEERDVLIAHAWPDFYNNSGKVRWSEGPASRSAFVFAFETAPVPKEKGVALPVYTPAADLACSYLSVLFGKRFDNHGLVENSGYFHAPDLTSFSILCNHQLPQNTHSPRVDFQIPLNLVEVSRIKPLFHDEHLDTKFLRAFQTASKFYLQALQNIEHDPEVAYLHLITSGEILSNFHEYDKSELLDNQTKCMLSTIINEVKNGKKIASFFTGKFLQIKKRFVKTILLLTDESFFSRSESKQPYGRFKYDNFQETISAAYDLRSRYVHTGIPFGTWVGQSAGKDCSEVQFGKPVLEDRELSKILAKAPTFIGLERIIRYCLLRFAESHGAYIELNKQ